MIYKLNFIGLSTLFSQDPSTESKGGFQSLLVKLQRKTDLLTSCIVLKLKDIERIIRYATKYGNGGWENKLKAIYPTIIN